MSPIIIRVPEALTTQKAELEATLAGIATEEERLAVQRRDIQVALQSITTAVAVLSGQPLPDTKPATATGATRRPMSEEAKKRIAEGLRRSALLRAAAKAAQVVSAPQAVGRAPADAQVEVSAPETPVEVPPDAPVVVSAPQEPVEALADASVPDSPRGPRASRKGTRA